MEPNYNFENEISEQYNVKNYEFRTVAQNLLNKHKTINQKEYDVILWIGCNLPTSSIVRDTLFKALHQKNVHLNYKAQNNLQLKINL